MPANVSGGSPGDSGSSTVSSSPCSETAGAPASPDDAPVRAVSGLERDRLEESGDEEQRTGDAETAAPGIARVEVHWKFSGLFRCHRGKPRSGRTSPSLVGIRPPSDS